MKFEGKESIVKEVQKAVGITANGIDDKVTWDAIIKGILECKGQKELIKCVQRILKVEDDGFDGPITWKTIKRLLVEEEEFVTPETHQHEAEEHTEELLSPAALKLILDYEVGGGEAYYNKYLKRPCWPKGASGVTIGIGYDCGYNTEAQFEKDWQGKIAQSDFIRLKKTLGYKGTAASRIIDSVKDIQIPWDAAFDVFKQNTVPRFIKLTLRTFPGADQLHPDAFGALVSLVFNRGGSIKGDSRREMANIRNLISSKDYKAIAKEITNMKRIWVGKGLDGLLRRRDKEAAMVAACA